MPGATVGKTYCPDPLLVAVLVSFVAVFTNSADASGTTALALSMTVPRTIAVLAVCARAGTADSKATSRTDATSSFVSFVKTFILPPTSESVDEQGRNSGGIEDWPRSLN